MHGEGTGEICTVIYNPNGGTGEQEEIQVKAGLSITLKECNYSKEGYEFVGWYENANGEGEALWPKDKYQVTKDTTLYAIWEKHVDFSMGYGRIEVVWLDIDDNVISEPNIPKLGNMIPVKWEGFTEKETTASDSEWYSYKAKEGIEDNLDSYWANAKNKVGDVESYFVWIPRYAYRITYYESKESDKITGYCDPNGIQDIYGNVQQSIRKYSKIS